MYEVPKAPEKELELEKLGVGEIKLDVAGPDDKKSDIIPPELGGVIENIDFAIIMPSRGLHPSRTPPFEPGVCQCWPPRPL